MSISAAGTQKSCCWITPCSRRLVATECCTCAECRERILACEAPPGSRLRHVGKRNGQPLQSPTSTSSTSFWYPRSFLPGLRFLAALLAWSTRRSGLRSISSQSVFITFSRVFLLLSAYPRIHIFSTSLPAWYSCSIFGCFDIVYGLGALARLGRFFRCFCAACQIVDRRFQVGAFAGGRNDRGGKSGGPPPVGPPLNVKRNIAHCQSPRSSSPRSCGSTLMAAQRSASD